MMPLDAIHYSPSSINHHYETTSTNTLHALYKRAGDVANQDLASWSYRGRD